MKHGKEKRQLTSRSGSLRRRNNSVKKVQKRKEPRRKTNHTRKYDRQPANTQAKHNSRSNPKKLKKPTYLRSQCEAQSAAGLSVKKTSTHESEPCILESESEEEDLLHPTGLPPSKLMSQFENRLRGGRFRFLNQGLYLSTGKDSFSVFKKNVQLFHEYHEGYVQSMQQWSVQPVDVAIRWLQKQKPKQNIVDYGCGEARIMKAHLSHKVTSLDLVALHPDVVSCDMADSPLNDASQDIAIFSLSLMGTDYHRCLLDAARVLKVGGQLWTAEVCSRFVDRRGKEDYHPFLHAMEALGFERTLAKKPSNLFVVLIFKKLKEVDKRTRIQWPQNSMNVPNGFHPIPPQE